MSGELLRQVLLVSLAAGVSLWALSALLFRVGGTWERVLSDDEKAVGTHAERITLAQLGPLVKGRRDVVGGYQEFSGFVFGRSVRLTRRDHGASALAAQGFPDAVAKQLDGEVMAKMNMRLTEGGTHLAGEFLPQKVEFTHRPPRITDAYFLEAQTRRYRRVVPLAEPAGVEAWQEEITGEHVEPSVT
jgi:hypothetical protein